MAHTWWVVQAFLTGLGTAFSLIIAIGAQNAFVLRQGIRREHVLPVVLICAINDAVMMLLGTAGIGLLIERAPIIIMIVMWGGIVFLLWYAWSAFRRAFRPEALSVDEQGAATPLKRTILACLAIALLNPHVYLDTMVIMGSVANAWESAKWWFTIGGATASMIWFFTLGYGARSLTRFFSTPRSWQILDAVIGVFMLVIAGLLMQFALSEMSW